MNQELTGARVKEMLRGSVAVLTNNKEHVNALNVFPVPDGDTGTNMVLTIDAALREAEKADDSLCAVAMAASSGSLMGARGNSGVILSQFFRGVAVALTDKQQVGPKEIAHAMTEAVQTAYRAVMKPVEGTILTVARMAAEGASNAARHGGDSKDVLSEALSAAKTALSETPSLLPVLKEAGVVDSGGQGLVYILEGALAVFNGEVLPSAFVPPTTDHVIVDHTELFEADLAFGYCTEVLLRGRNLVQDVIRRQIASLGDSVMVVGDVDTTKVHIHTNHPGTVLEKLIAFGTLHDIKIDNLKEQQIEFQKEVAMNPQLRETKPLGVVAVALGPGIQAIFEGLGVDVVLAAGQTMNPSTEELLAAVDDVGAENVLILPNNKNVILAAMQAKELSSIPIEVIPTSAISQGIGAMVAYKPDADMAINKEHMTAAADKIQTAEITYAVRATTVDGRDIEPGDIMGLIDGELRVAGKEVPEVTLKALTELVTDETELITLLYGEDVPASEARSLAAQIENRFEDCEVETYSGGQPLYYYIVAVE